MNDLCRDRLDCRLSLVWALCLCDWNCALRGVLGRCLIWRTQNLGLCLPSRRLLQRLIGSWFQVLDNACCLHDVLKQFNSIGQLHRAGAFSGRSNCWRSHFVFGGSRFFLWQTHFLNGFMLFLDFNFRRSCLRYERRNDLLFLDNLCWGRRKSCLLRI